MAFNVTYHRLAENNIRNIYGGLPAEIRWRQFGDAKALNSAQRNHERQRRPTPVEQFLDSRYYEFDYENDIRVPRAPAFRLLSRSKVDDIVNRLSQPTVSKRRRASDICHRELKRSMSETCHKCRSATARQDVGSKRLDEITNRLLLPTVTSNVRNSMRCLREMSIADIHQACSKHNSCDRCSMTPSGRFDKEFSNLV